MLGNIDGAKWLSLGLIGGAALLFGCSEGGGSSDISGGGGGNTTSDGSGGSASGAINYVGKIATLAGVIAHSEKNGVESESTYFDAVFSENAALSLPAPGACAVPPAAGDGALVSGGTLKITGGVAPITIPVAHGMTYSFTDPTHADWTAGTMLKISVTGSQQIKAFSTSVVAPGRALLTSPTVPNAAVALQKGLPLRWKPVADGKLFVTLDGPARGSSTLRASLECVFDASDGSASIPASTLSSVFGPGGGTLISQTLGVATSVDVDWHIVVAVSEQGQPTLPITFH